MAPSPLLTGLRLLAVALAALALQAATQWTAAALAPHPGLGPPWFEVLGFRAYPPWRLFEWWLAYGSEAPTVFRRAGILAASGGVACALLSLALPFLRETGGKASTAYGSARWANRREVRRAGLLAGTGVVLGRLGRRHLLHDGPEHVMAFAPTRSGKGVGLVVPTLLTWPGSAIVHDIKGENWNLTAGWRARFSHCIRFDPTDPASSHFNPLLEIRRGPFEVRDAQNVADILVDPDGSLARRTHWDLTAHSLLVGAILHVLHAGREKTLAGVAELLSDPETPFATTLRRMMATRHLDHGPHPVVAQTAREVLDKSPPERSAVLSTALSFLSLYRDPLMARLTRRSDWRIRDLVDAPDPVSLYLAVPPSDLSRTRPFIRLLVNQIGRRLTERLEEDGTEGSRRRLLLMLDEFPALGRLDSFETSLAFMAGYGIRAFLVAQSLNQVAKAYGENNAILDNCHVRIAFAANDERTARRVSDAAGTATESRTHRTLAGKRLGAWLDRTSVSRVEGARQLLTPGEVMQLGADEEVVFVSGCPPVRARKVRFHEEPDLARRRLPPPSGAASSLPETDPDDWTGRPLPPVPDVAPASPGKPPEAEVPGAAKPEVNERLFLELGELPGLAAEEE